MRGDGEFDLFGKDETPKLPEGWTWARIGDTGRYINGFPFKPTDREASGVPIIRIQNLTDTTKPINRTTRVVPDDYYVDPGDLLVSWSATLDAFIWRGERGLLNQHIFRVLPYLELFDPRLLFHWLRATIQELLKTEHLHGSTMKHINRSPFMAQLIPVPPRSEQVRIADCLDEILSDLDAGIQELKAVQKKLAKYRQSLLKAAVDGTLTASWREAHRQREGEPDETGAQLLERILVQRRARWEARQLTKLKENRKALPEGWQRKYFEPVRPDTNGLLPLPEGWLWASAEQLCEFITKGTTPPKDLDCGETKVVPFIRVTNLTANGTLDLIDKVFVSEKIHSVFLARSVVYPNDVLMNIVGPPLGQVAVVPPLFAEWNINQAIAIFRAVEGVLPGFMCISLMSFRTQRWLKARAKTTAGQTNLTLELCRSLPISFPSLKEQTAVVEIVRSAIEAIDADESEIKQCLRRSAVQRQNILKAAFSGQLVPQDPNDEPASVLLERIRGERAARASNGSARKRKVKATA